MSDELHARTPTYRMPRSRGIDPATRRLAMIAAGLGGVLFVVVGVWSAMAPGHGGVPIIEPPAGPMRIKPPNPGGMKLTAADGILLSDVDSREAGKLAPPPEVPDPQALMPPSPPQVSAPAAAVPTTPVSASHEAATTPPPPAAAATPAQPVAAPRTEYSSSGPAKSATSGPALVQLAALASREQAEAQWKLLQRQMPELLAGRTPAIAEARINGRTWWRVRAGSFADAAAASSFCGRIRAKGAACSVARF